MATKKYFQGLPGKYNAKVCIIEPTHNAISIKHDNVSNAPLRAVEIT